MTTISIIGSGNMATAIGTRAAKHGHTIEVMSRDTAKAQALAGKIGNGATAGTFGGTPLGDIVIVAVPYTNAVSVVANYGDALAGKVIIDISNTFNADATGLVTPDGISGAQDVGGVIQRMPRPVFRQLMSAGPTPASRSTSRPNRLPCPASSGRLRTGCWRDRTSGPMTPSLNSARWQDSGPGC